MDRTEIEIQCGFPVLASVSPLAAWLANQLAFSPSQFILGFPLVV